MTHITKFFDEQEYFPCSNDKVISRLYYYPFLSIFNIFFGFLAIIANTIIITTFFLYPKLRKSPGKSKFKILIFFLKEKI